MFIIVAAPRRMAPIGARNVQRRHLYKMHAALKDAFQNYPKTVSPLRNVGDPPHGVLGRLILQPTVWNSVQSAFSVKCQLTRKHCQVDPSQRIRRDMLISCVAIGYWRSPHNVAVEEGRTLFLPYQYGCTETFLLPVYPDN